MPVEVKATYIHDWDNENLLPGSYTFLNQHDTNVIVGMRFVCPCGCGSQDLLMFNPSPTPKWLFDGNEDAPTVTPSVYRKQGCGWHGWLKKGGWIRL